jgi:hypothetical protein
MVVEADRDRQDVLALRPRGRRESNELEFGD